MTSDDLMDETAVRELWRQLVERTGGVRSTARAYNLGASYVADVRGGRRRVDGEKILKILGLRKVVGYEPVPSQV